MAPWRKPLDVHDPATGLLGNVHATAMAGGRVTQPGGEVSAPGFAVRVDDAALEDRAGVARRCGAAGGNPGRPSGRSALTGRWAPRAGRRPLRQSPPGLASPFTGRPGSAGRSGRGRVPVSPGIPTRTPAASSRPRTRTASKPNTLRVNAISNNRAAAFCCTGVPLYLVLHSGCRIPALNGHHPNPEDITVGIGLVTPSGYGYGRERSSSRRFRFAGDVPTRFSTPSPVG